MNVSFLQNNSYKEQPFGSAGFFFWMNIPFSSWTACTSVSSIVWWGLSFKASSWTLGITNSPHFSCNHEISIKKSASKICFTRTHWQQSICARINSLFQGRALKFISQRGHSSGFSMQRYVFLRATCQTSRLKINLSELSLIEIIVTLSLCSNGQNILHYVVRK